MNLKIDSTDQKTGFIDDNSIDAGLYLPGLGINDLLAQGKIGIDVSYARPIHDDQTHDLDATLTVGGWFPFLQSINLLSKTTQRGSPLSLSASYGYRSKRLSGTTADGTLFSGTAGYHFYVLDNYRVDFTTTTTWTGTDKLPAGTPKTQHYFKAQILYAATPTSKFGIVTSVENGSIGPVLDKVRNYFIGVALSQIFEGRAGGNQ